MDKATQERCVDKLIELYEAYGMQPTPLGNGWMTKPPVLMEFYAWSALEGMKIPFGEVVNLGAEARRRLQT